MKDRWYYWRGGTLFLKVHVLPQSRHNEICGLTNKRLRIKLKAPPVDGKANRQLIEMLACDFHTGKSNISIAGGAKGRDKLVAIAAPACIPAWFTSLAKV